MKIDLTDKQRSVLVALLSNPYLPPHEQEILEPVLVALTPEVKR